MIYLDTHVVLWLYEGDMSKFTQQAKQLMANEQLVVSAMVVLELQYLYEIKRVTVPAEEIISYLVEKVGVRVCGLPFEKITQKALQLPTIRDPFDRLIVANAMANNGVLVTKDQNIHLCCKSVARW